MIGAHELIVDSFAGGGGASLGIERGAGRSPDIAVNHNDDAIGMHTANHPATHHVLGDVWDADPETLCAGRPVGLAWFSPDCKHFSKAKGGKPVEKKIRGLAWVVVKWARAVKPRIIMLENVSEFSTWGPLTDDHKPDPAKRGETYRRWVAELEACGYVVEMRELRACDYGAPTIRKRLFIIARSDGQPIVWPEPTHGPGRPLPYRTAAECIDWSLPCPSIFERARPLANKTLRRIARGIHRFVLNTATPFIIPVTHAGDERSHSVAEPFRTITAAHRGEHALIVPTLIQTGYGERPGQAPRSLDLHAPLGTCVAGGAKHAVVAAFLAKHYGGHEATGSDLREAISTITCQDHHSLVASSLVKLRGTCADGQALDQPMPTVTAGGTHVGEVRAFLTRYNGVGEGQVPSLPLGTVTTRDRFGLVTVHGEDYAIVDIGMRMLQPRELFRAQSFPDSYVIDHTADGRLLTKTAQTRLCGNSAPPVVVAAIVSANIGVRKAEAA